MIVRDPLSDLYIAICSGCDLHEHIDSDSGFGAASLATGAGWSLGLKDLCRTCTAAQAAPARRRAKTA